MCVVSVLAVFQIYHHAVSRIIPYHLLVSHIMQLANIYTTLLMTACLHYICVVVFHGFSINF